MDRRDLPKILSEIMFITVEQTQAKNLDRISDATFRSSHVKAYALMASHFSLLTES